MSAPTSQQSRRENLRDWALTLIGQLDRRGLPEREPQWWLAWAADRVGRNSSSCQPLPPWSTEGRALARRRPAPASCRPELSLEQLAAALTAAEAAAQAAWSRDSAEPSTWVYDARAAGALELAALRQEVHHRAHWPNRRRLPLGDQVQVLKLERRAHDADANRPPALLAAQ